MPQMIHFQFESHDVRTLTHDNGTTWWVAKDVCAVLGIQNSRQNLARHPDNEKGVCTTYTLGGPQEVVTVNEPGLYRLIFQSRKPEAEAFKHWVFHDVLPQIRKTGSYHMPGKLPPPEQARRPREHAEVSTHLIAVWTVLRQATEPLTNREIASQAGVASRTARAHTRYLLDLGLLDLHETFPRHLYEIAAQAEKRQAAYWQRLEQIAAILERRTSLRLPEEVGRGWQAAP